MNDPLTARFRYKHRNLINYGGGLAVLALLIILFTSLFPEFNFIMACIAIAVWWAYVNIMAYKVIWIRCEKCGNDIATNTPWICGLCGKKHTNGTRYPFVGHCAECGDEPKAYQCHHENCGALIFLSRDRVKTGYAVSANMPVPQKPPIQVKKDVAAEKITQLDKEIEITHREVKKAELDIKLKGFKDVLEPKKSPTQREITEENFSNFEDRNMIGAEIVRRKRADVSEKYKDNPSELERQNRLIDQWAKDHLDIM